MKKNKKYANVAFCVATSRIHSASPPAERQTDLLALPLPAEDHNPQPKLHHIKKHTYADNTDGEKCKKGKTRKSKRMANWLADQLTSWLGNQLIGQPAGKSAGQ